MEHTSSLVSSLSYELSRENPYYFPFSLSSSCLATNIICLSPGPTIYGNNLYILPYRVYILLENSDGSLFSFNITYLITNFLQEINFYIRVANLIKFYTQYRNLWNDYNIFFCDFIPNLMKWYHLISQSYVHPQYYILVKTKTARIVDINSILNLMQQFGGSAKTFTPYMKSIYSDINVDRLQEWIEKYESPPNLDDGTIEVISNPLLDQVFFQLPLSQSENTTCLDTSYIPPNTDALILGRIADML